MRKKIICGIGICLAFVFIILYSFIDKKYPIYDQDILAEELILSAMLEENTSVSQTFRVEGKSLKAVSLKCAVDGAERKGGLLYKVYNDVGNIVREGEVPIEKLKSEKYNDFEFETIEDCQGKEYTFEVCGIDIGDCNISFYKTVDNMDNTILRRNQEIEVGTLALKSVTYTFDWETLIVVFCFTVYIVAFIRMLYKFFR